jgi:glycerophosphoryl diester phosphodiesterase
MTRLAAVVVLLVSSLGSPAAAHGQPVVYAHRGGSALAPENTLGAFRNAYTLYGDRGVWLEMDVQLTADGVLVVIHDDDLDRTTDCTGTVISKTYAEVAACDASKPKPDWPHPEPVPSFQKVLEEGKEAGWRLMVEIKNIPGEANFDPVAETAAAELVRLVEASGFPKQDLLVQSFWPPSLDQTKLRDPELRVALLTTSQLPGAPQGGGFTVTENAAFAKARGYEVSAPDHRSVDMGADAVSAAHLLGIEVVVWTVNTNADIERALGWDLDGIISDHPDRVYAALDQT